MRGGIKTDDRFRIMHGFVIEEYDEPKVPTPEDIAAYRRVAVGMLHNYWDMPPFCAGPPPRYEPPLEDTP